MARLDRIKKGDTDYLDGRRHLPEAGLSKSLLYKLSAIVFVDLFVCYTRFTCLTNL